VKHFIFKTIRRIIGGDDPMGGTTASLRNIIVWVFIAVVALFLTHPAGEPRSGFDRPVPWPAELGAENPGI
jgi:hypothetical protein